MTTAELLARLERKRGALDIAIAEIRAVEVLRGYRAKAKAIVASVKHTKQPKGVNALLPLPKKHWTQTPAGKKKMATIQKKAWRARKKADRKANEII